MLWDGLDFFGHDYMKLPRLRGVKTSWTDKFKNKERMIPMTIVFIVALILTITESSKIG